MTEQELLGSLVLAGIKTDEDEQMEQPGCLQSCTTKPIKMTYQTTHWDEVADSRKGAFSWVPLDSDHLQSPFSIGHALAERSETEKISDKDKPNEGHCSMCDCDMYGEIQFWCVSSPCKWSACFRCWNLFELMRLQSRLKTVRVVEEVAAKAETTSDPTLVPLSSSEEADTHSRRLFAELQQVDHS